MRSFVARAVAIVALAAPLALTVAAQQPSATAEASGAPFSDGEVRKVDKDAKKITIKHGPIANLDMPPMTMVFQVKDPALLEKVKAGDKIRFRAQKAGGAYTATHIEPAK